MGQNSPNDYKTSQGKTFVFSLVLHVIIIMLGVFGLPHLKKDVYVQPPISVEIAMVDAKVEDIVKVKEKPKEDVKKAPPVEKEKPVETPKQALTQTPPKEQPVEQEPQKEEAAPPPPPKETSLKKPPPKKPKRIEEPKPTPIKEVEKEEPKKEKNIDAFASVLKNLAPDEEASKPKTSQDGQVSQTITADELSAVRQQLTRCWNLLPGAQDADQLAVELRIQVFQDRVVKSVEVVDKDRYARDPFFRAAADNAVRAVRNPACSPLNLPPNKYDLWKDIIFNFDPQGMF